MKGEEEEIRAVVVTDPVETSPSDAGSRTEKMLEFLLTKVTDLSQGQKDSKGPCSQYPFRRAESS